jgi:hypothetical protein
LVFNQDTEFLFHSTHKLNGLIENGINQWTPLEDASKIDKYQFSFRLMWKGGTSFSIEDVETGAVQIQVIASSPHIPIDENIDINSPLTLDNGLKKFGDHLYYEMFGPPPQGTWTVEIDGEVDGVYDLGLESPYDEGGNFLYYLPSVRLTVDDISQEITGVELRFFIWNPAIQQYETLDTSANTLPLGEILVFELTSYGEDNPFGSVKFFSLPVEIGPVIEPPEPIFWGVKADQYSLSWVNVMYKIGAQYSFSFNSPEFD